MANYLYLARETKLYVEVGSTVWEVPILDGFSFSQATTASEVTLAEMENATGVSRRSKKVFNDALAPVEWSFSTYSRPFMSAAGGGTDADGAARTHAVEEVMWALLAGQAYYDPVTYDFKDQAAGTPYFTWASDAGVNDELTIDWASSNKSTLGTARLIFQVGSGAGIKYYEITGSVCNEATIDFDIDGIAMVNWSGFGSVLAETTAPTVDVAEAITSTNNFIRNRLTQLTIAPNKTGDDTGNYLLAQETQMEDAYAITLTGGNITISNNITFITPEELGFVNYPIGHVTGNRSFGGNFTCYLDWADAGSDESADFWQDMAGLTDVVTHSFNLEFAIGGTAEPKMTVKMPTSHVEIPTHSIEDVISLETNFTGLATSFDLANEATVVYQTTIVGN